MQAAAFVLVPAMSAQAPAAGPLMSHAALAMARTARSA
jgi:hypothetical protein